MRNPPLSIPLYLCGQQLPSLNTFKVAEILIQSDLQWNHRTDAILKKQVVFPEEVAKNQRGHFRLLYTPAWHRNLTQALSNQIKSVHQFITGRVYSTSQKTLQTLALSILQVR